VLTRGLLPDVDAILAMIRTSWGEGLLGAVLDRSFRVPPAPADRAALLAWAAELSPQPAYDVLASQRDLDLTAALAGIAQPAVVLHGRFRSTRTPPRWPPRCGTCSRGPVTAVASAGHDSAPGSVSSRGRAVIGAKVASRRKAQHGSSRTVFHEGYE
jgi:hypothetical protein